MTIKKMRNMLRTFVIFGFMTLLACGCRTAMPVSSQSHLEGGPVYQKAAGDFDLFVLSLSWSPEFCQNNTTSAQCGMEKGFILHGLWPQFETYRNTKMYPEDCTGPEINNQIASQFSELYAAKSQLTHEWNKHGTCSGLGPKEYLQLAKDTFNRLNIPQAYRHPTTDLQTTVSQMKLEFLSVNPWLRTNALVVKCNDTKKVLESFYVCLDKANLSARDCPAVLLRQNEKSCANAELTLLNVQAR